jgi:hypothetical protein
MCSSWVVLLVSLWGYHYWQGFWWHLVRSCIFVSAPPNNVAGPMCGRENDRQDQAGPVDNLKERREICHKSCCICTEHNGSVCIGRQT